MSTRIRRLRLGPWAAQRSASLPWLVLAAGLLLSGLATLATAQDDQQQRHRRAMELAEEVGSALDNRLASTVAILSATAGLFQASREVSRDEFHRFFHALKLTPTTLQGIQGIGFAAKVPAGSERQRFVEQIRRDGQPGFRLWPPAGTAAGGQTNPEQPDLTSAIVYLQPQDWRNQRAIGFNMYGEPTRRAAMARAAISGQPMLTAPVRLVQEAESDVQVGTLVYLPVRRSDAVRELGEAESLQSSGGVSDLIGWAYAPIRMGNLLSASLAMVRHPDLAGSRVMVFDGSEPERSRQLADSSRNPIASPPPDTVWIERPLLERQWLIGVALDPGPRFLLGIPPVVLLTATAGGLASTVAALGARLAISNQRMTLDALEKARKGSEERALAAAVFDASPIAMIVTDPDGVVQEAKVAFSQISGWSQREAVGHKANLLRSGLHDDLF